MNKGIHLKRMIAIILIIMVLGSMLSMVNASTVESILVRDGKQETLTISLQANQKIVGEFNISGSREDLIDFWVRDPTGNIILDSGTVANGENFTFTANIDGEYTLNFENNLSYNKYIDLKYDIETIFLPDLLNQGSNLIWIIIGAVVIGLALIGVGIAVLLRRNRNKPPNPPL